MKRLILFLLVPLFLACSTDEPKYSLNSYYVSLATVTNPAQETAFFVELDNNVRMWTAASNLLYYRPKDGQRIIANYSILNSKRDSAYYKHDIKLNNVYEVLTKGIFNITPKPPTALAMTISALMTFGWAVVI